MLRKQTVPYSEDFTPHGFIAVGSLDGDIALGVQTHRAIVEIG